MPAAPIDFYFDFSSPYGYFAATRVEAMAQKHGRWVNWQPILLGTVFKITGGQPLPSLPLKGDYAKRDIARSARLLDVPFKYPSKFPISGVSPSRAMTWLTVKDQQKAKDLALALYRAFFVNDRDISNPDITVEVATELGHDREAVITGMNDQGTKDTLRKEVEAAMAKGVFGSPYFVIDGEPFWGHDRIDQVDLWLEKGGW
jgi:2-hydroxychromene-2-carboxylate isomerase